MLPCITINIDSEIIYAGEDITLPAPIHKFTKVELEIKNRVNYTKVINYTKVTEPFTPTRIVITKAFIDASVIPVGFVANQLQAPTDYTSVGWDSESGNVGTVGTVIMDGHYDSKIGAAVFFNLKDLSINDEVKVYSVNGKYLIYRVVDMILYDRFTAPTSEIFSNDKKKRLNLITCGGTFNRKLGSYNQRLVVYTVLE